MAASNYYQPFDKCNINCSNIIKHYNAHAILSGYSCEVRLLIFILQTKNLHGLLCFKLDAVMDL